MSEIYGCQSTVCAFSCCNPGVVPNSLGRRTTAAARAVGGGVAAGVPAVSRRAAGTSPEGARSGARTGEEKGGIGADLVPRPSPSGHQPPRQPPPLLGQHTSRRQFRGRGPCRGAGLGRPRPSAWPTGRPQSLAPSRASGAQPRASPPPPQLRQWRRRGKEGPCEPGQGQGGPSSQRPRQRKEPPPRCRLPLASVTRWPLRRQLSMRRSKRTQRRRRAVVSKHQWEIS